MINYSDIRTDMVTGLRDYLRNTTEGILIIQQNSGAPEPSKPYLTYHFTSPMTPESLLGSETWEEDGDNVEITSQQLPTMSCSFTVYSDDPDEAKAIGLDAMSWFSHHGYDYLQSKEIVVADMHGLQNRDIYQEDRWSRRVGFDVILRVVSKITKTVEAIETVDITEGE